MRCDAMIPIVTRQLKLPAMKHIARYMKLYPGGRLVCDVGDDHLQNSTGYTDGWRFPSQGRLSASLSVSQSRFAVEVGCAQFRDDGSNCGGW